MHNHIFRKIDAARLCEQELGLSPGTIAALDADDDGMVDGEPVLYNTSKLQDLQGSPETGVVYFGDLVVESYNTASCDAVFQTDTATFKCVASDGYQITGSVFPCMIWKTISVFNNINAHFYGWKFTYTV